MMNEKKIMILAIQAKLEFPEGFYTGAGEKNGNFLSLARNGQGKPLLRGSSVAGFLRHAMERKYSPAKVESLFGHPLAREEEREESRVIFEDAPFDFGGKNLFVDETDHNFINRHTGAVSKEDKGLFSLERVPSKSSCLLFFYIRGEEGSQLIKEGEVLVSMLHQATLGGSANRGCGRCFVKDEKYKRRLFDMTKVEDAATFLDLLYGGVCENIPEAEECDIATTGDQVFILSCELIIPPGQDILCAGGHDAYPVSCFSANGGEYWKIPGSTLRGLCRAWIARLAVRGGRAQVDSVERYEEIGKMREVDRAKLQDYSNDPVANLFGSLQNKGRIHFSDAISNNPTKSIDVQKRKHVVIDRFTGGTNEGKLFENSVLVGGSGLKFSLTISIDHPNQDELNWLSKSLKAIHLGLIRIGSAKSSGRLEINATQIQLKPRDLDFTLEL